MFPRLPKEERRESSLCGHKGHGFLHKVDDRGLGIRRRARTRKLAAEDDPDKAAGLAHHRPTGSANTFPGPPDQLCDRCRSESSCVVFLW
ncbi:hypothetical protein D3C83_32590 [compost metagenome]